MVLFLIFIAGCGGDSISTMDDCVGLAKSPQADACFTEFAVELVKRDGSKGEKVISDGVENPKVLDYIWLTLSKELELSNYRYCDMIVESAMEDRCRTIVGRPHLRQRKNGHPSQTNKRQGPQNHRKGLPSPG